MNAKHAAQDTVDLDPSNGEDAAYINDAARCLAIMWDGQGDDALGDGGPRDAAASLIALLSGDLDEDAEEYTIKLFRAAANKIVDRTPALAHWL